MTRRFNHVGWLIGGMTVALLTVMVYAQQPAPTSPLAPASAASGQSSQGQSSQAAPNSQYVGSSTCQRCHEPEFETWSNTLHIQMTKPIGSAKIEGDFSGTSSSHLQQNGRTYSMETRNGRYFVSIAQSSAPAKKYEVHYTLGARRFQGYLSKLPDGRIYVLPVFWHDETKRWMDWKEITPVPDDPDHDLRQIWNVTCVNCHATNLVKNFDPAHNTYATSWTEMGIGCEACHGPGSQHVGLMNEWEREPTKKQAYQARTEPGRVNEALQIFSFSPEESSSRQIFDTCGYCHGNKNNVFFGFKPGDRYEDYASPFLISQPIPDNDSQGEFWPDGRPSRFNRPQALMMSGCFQKGQATCTSCHKMHGNQSNHALKVAIDAPDDGYSKESDTLCTQCHGDLERQAVGQVGQVGQGQVGRENNPTAGLLPSTGYGGTLTPPRQITDLRAHTHHAPDSQGSRCIACHMADLNWRLLNRRRDHTFQPPVPELTARFGEPNACTTCHEDKSPEWAASIMDRWYGNGERRRTLAKTAETIYRAGSGDVTALPDVVRIALDRSEGALMRASAAEFAGQLIATMTTPRPSAGGPHIDVDVMNGLVGAAADPEPVVRINAVRALILVRDGRVPPVLAAHLTDSVRLVRVSASEGLLGLGISRLDGPNGAALTHAQDEWSSSLRTFNDVASDHTTLGWLDSARGMIDEASRELRVAVSLDPADAKAHVYLGVIAARAGRFDEALQEFKAAKTLSPTYPNVDILIDEASKRAQRRH